MTIKIVQGVARQQRKMRRPEHTYQLRQKPYAIQPFLIAPVLPGETVENVLTQGRAVSDPVKNPLVGWWLEQYYFYVKLRDLPDRDTLTALMLGQNPSLTALREPADHTFWYTAKNGINFPKMCLQRVTEEYFRNEGEAWNDASNYVAGIGPLASINRDGWFDSLMDATTAVPAANDFQDKPDQTVLASYSAMYDHMRAMRTTTKTFEDWLAEWGVHGVEDAADEQQYKPELVRYVKSWTYPTNTVEPTTGVPSSAAVWSWQERADKKRFIKEPGFIFGVQIVRPKVYLSKQKGNVAAHLDKPELWLPPVYREELYTAIKQFVSGATPDGPLGANPTNGYWVDMRDLFIYGDQFVNFDIVTNTDGSSVALPTAALQKRYASTTDIDALFVNAAGGKNLIRTDGICHLHILGQPEVATDAT